MSFKNKMHKRGVSKLDNLVETPDYIEVKTPVKNKWNFLKIAIPVTAGLALIVIPFSVLAANGVFSAKNASQKGDQKPGEFDPSYDDSKSGEAPGESDQMEPAAETQKDLSFTSLLEKYNIKQNYVIEVYDYADGLSPAHTFTNEQAISIVDSLKGIDSNFDSYISKLDGAKRNSMGYVMGINHRLIFKDGTHKMVSNYFSQFSSLIIDSSAFDLSTSTAYALLDSNGVEMDYDANYDETIN